MSQSLPFDVESPYEGYTYAYPHKTAYRALSPALDLDRVWAEEDRGALFLYAHVPFCEMRCGFCNLFTMARPDATLGRRFVDTLRHQAEITREALGDDTRFVRLAIGGGTPTQLALPELEALIDICEHTMGADALAVPMACETSPETATDDKLALLRERGVNRISVGIQSFFEDETRALRRPQPTELAHAALTRLRDAGFDTLNLDLIYGIPGQTEATWRASLEQALDYTPEEIFLYPLYVREMTGLGRSRHRDRWSDQRLEMYRAGREELLKRGYVQQSMRMFRRADAPRVAGADYTCQRDGMVGLGVGARSYTRAVHYSTEWAVGRRGVVALIDEWVGRDPARFARVEHGFVLDGQERRRRHALLSILNCDGLDLAAWRARFGAPATDDLPQLARLVDGELLVERGGALVPTERGLELSDAIGPWLYSEPVRARMADYEVR